MASTSKSQADDDVVMIGDEPKWAIVNFTQANKHNLYVLFPVSDLLFAEDLKEPVTSVVVHFQKRSYAALNVAASGNRDFLMKNFHTLRATFIDEMVLSLRSRSAICRHYIRQTEKRRRTKELFTAALELSPKCGPSMAPSSSSCTTYTDAVLIDTKGGVLVPALKPKYSDKENVNPNVGGSSKHKGRRTRLSDSKKQPSTSKKNHSYQVGDIFLHEAEAQPAPRRSTGSRKQDLSLLEEQVPEVSSAQDEMAR